MWKGHCVIKGMLIHLSIRYIFTEFIYLPYPAHQNSDQTRTSIPHSPMYQAYARGLPAAPHAVIFGIWHLTLKSGRRSFLSVISQVERELTHGIRALASSMPSIDLFLAGSAVLEGWPQRCLSHVLWSLWERKLVFRVLCFLFPENLMLPCWSRAPSPIDLSLPNCTDEDLLCQASRLSYS